MGFGYFVIFVRKKQTMELHVTNETGRLREVVLGMPWSNGPVPSLAETFDSKSYESVLNGVYPAEQDIAAEMSAFKAVLEKYGVKVYRPALVENCNQVFSREQLLEEVWGYEYYGDIRTVDVTIRRLREKVEDDPSEPKYIRTKRGIGYYFRRP